MRGFWALLAILLVGCAPAPADDRWFAPDFELRTLTGAPLRLSDLRGGWVIVTFWATWCAPCAEELPALQTLYDSGVVSVIAVNLREGEETVRPYVDRLGLRFPILLQPTDPVVLDYAVVGLPQTFVITPEGEVVWRGFGPGLPPALWE